MAFCSKIGNFPKTLCNKKYPPGGGYFLLQVHLLSHFRYVGSKGLAVNTLTVLRTALVSTYLDHIKAAVICGLAVILALVNGTLNALINFTGIDFHNSLHSAFIGFLLYKRYVFTSLI